MPTSSCRIEFRRESGKFVNTERRIQLTTSAEFSR